ncbi:DUF4743 domain-containing protein [Aquincola sp. MAHUQ-54]|uniref:DUF4743 domain-containing protein n=1 Tax=Aquincola agrisoli TaxID=3119538 RepID=A0AAW9QER9_9BURK
MPFLLGRTAVGSVGVAHLGVLALLAAASTRPALCRVEATGVGLSQAAQATAWLSEVNDRLRARGLIPGWRDERYAVVDPAAAAGAPALAVIERAAARFWGTLTAGAHANGYVADASGRPTHLWIARRALSKATDPGKLDNLVGGGVPLGQSPFETLVREGWEEAGLAAARFAAAQPGRVLRLHRDVPEGLQAERLHVFDLALPAGVQPVNQDGEVAEFHCLPVDEALARARAGEMTVDAALVTLDFALRRRLLPPHEHDGVAQAFARLCTEPDGVQPV